MAFSTPATAETPVDEPTPLDPAKAAAFDAFCDQHLRLDYLTSDAQLTAALGRLRDLNPAEVSLDMEATGLLVQCGCLRTVQIGVATPTDRYQLVVDAWQCDATALVPLLASPRVTKNVHYSAYEEKMARWHLGTPLRLVYDTHSAWATIKRTLRNAIKDGTMADTDVPAQLHGWQDSANSLQALCDWRLGLALPKDEQLSDWSAQTLTDDQLRYAAADVLVLPELAADTRACAQTAGVTDQDIQGMRAWVLEQTFGEDRILGVHEADGSSVVEDALGRLTTPPTRDELTRWLRRQPVTLKNRQRILDQYAA